MDEIGRILQISPFSSGHVEHKTCFKGPVHLFYVAFLMFVPSRPYTKVSVSPNIFEGGKKTIRLYLQLPQSKKISLFLCI